VSRLLDADSAQRGENGNEEIGRVGWISTSGAPFGCLGPKPSAIEQTRRRPVNYGRGRGLGQRVMEARSGSVFLRNYQADLRGVRLSAWAGFAPAFCLSSKVAQLAHFVNLSLYA
jgi:hypothetical protein